MLAKYVKEPAFRFIIKEQLHIWKSPGNPDTEPDVRWKPYEKPRQYAVCMRQHSMLAQSSSSDQSERATGMISANHRHTRHLSTI
jgi:hypothetical protein